MRCFWRLTFSDVVCGLERWGVDLLRCRGSLLYPYHAPTTTSRGENSSHSVFVFLLFLYHCLCVSMCFFCLCNCCCFIVVFYPKLGLLGCCNVCVRVRSLFRIELFTKLRYVITYVDSVMDTSR